MRAGFYSQFYAKCRSYLIFTKWMTEWIYIWYFLHSALYIKDKAQTKKTSRSSQDEIGPLTKRSPRTSKVALTYTTKSKIDSYWKTAIDHSELSLVLCDGGRVVWRLKRKVKHICIHTHTHLQLTHDVTQQKPTQHCKAIIIQLN